MLCPVFDSVAVSLCPLASSWTFKRTGHVWEESNNLICCIFKNLYVLSFCHFVSSSCHHIVVTSHVMRLPSVTVHQGSGAASMALDTKAPTPSSEEGRAGGWLCWRASCVFPCFTLSSFESLPLKMSKCILSINSPLSFVTPICLSLSVCFLCLVSFIT